MLLTSLAFLLAATADAPAPDVAATAAPAREPKICQRVEETGTRLSRRTVCMTQKQWDKVSAETQRDFRDTLARRQH